MSNKSSCSMKKHSMKFAVIAVFFIFCSICLYTQEEKTKVDKDKFDKLTLEQKKEFVERAKETRDTALQSGKVPEKVIEISKDVAECKSAVDKVKFDKLTPEQKGMFKTIGEYDRAYECVKDYREVAKGAEKVIAEYADYAKEKKLLEEIRGASKEVFNTANAYKQKE
jgi:hypothetical protein